MLSRVSRSVVPSLARAFASTLVIAEHTDVALNPATLSTITAAKEIGAPITLLVAGSACEGAAAEGATVDGVSSVLVADFPEYEKFISEDITDLVVDIQKDKAFSHIVIPSSNNGKNMMPRIAVKLDVTAISEVTKVIAEDSFQRPMYAGNAMQTVKSGEETKVLTVRPTAFDKAGTGEAAPIETVPEVKLAGKSSFVSESLVTSDRPDLAVASVVVAGGRGMKDTEGFEKLYSLADKFGGAAVGATRAAVDAGMCPNDLQIGQTGKVVAPDLYVAVGISGAIQHVAGMKDSKTIVAINKDGEAPIFGVSDFGLVGDGFKVLDELMEKM
jgi:electron transfer flavoprotein alpha subunit